jgi:hypothetical protein
MGNLYEAELHAVFVTVCDIPNPATRALIIKRPRDGRMDIMEMAT